MSRVAQDIDYDVIMYSIASSTDEITQWLRRYCKVQDNTQDIPLLVYAK